MFVCLLQGPEQGVVERAGLSFPATLGFACSCPGRMLGPGVEAGASQGPSQWGLAVPRGALRGMQRPHWLTGSQGSLWPRPCLSGQAAPAEEQRTQETGSPAGRAKVACKPLLSQKVRGPCPHGACAQGPILLSSWNMSCPRGETVYDRGLVVGPHPPRDPGGTQLEPSLCLGVHSFRPRVVHPALAALPGGQCCCLWPCFQAGDGQQVFGSPPQVPLVSAGPQGPHAWASAEVPRNPRPDLGMVP